MGCNYLSPMDENGDVGAGLEIASIRYSATFIAASLLNDPGILLC